MKKTRIVVQSFAKKDDAMTDVMKYTGQTKAEDMKEELKIVQALQSSPSTKEWVKSAAMHFLVAGIWPL